ncbi:hypothetical protein [Microvirga arsenatis]|uniref:hypothetical protein n=1 Tax=Microvirga arsenatis TaxID=2692265 RepID=UPI001AEEB5AF|nr:hypothetical protein [Microvirga arsenatis]NBJ09438.1 hypothetical protein [Microvirga arsenatis]
MLYRHALPTMNAAGVRSNHALSNPTFRDTYPLLTNWSVFPLRLMGTIIVALLAITMAIIPISMPQAAASAGNHHAVRVDAGHENAAIAGDHEHADELAPSHDAALDASADHHQGSQECSGPVCCSMSTCHAFQESAAPTVYSPTVSQVSMAMAGDEQVEGITTGGLDRPPRTV